MIGERVLIDTSVWIDYFKAKNNPVAKGVDDILTYSDVYVPKIIIAELIQGAKSEKEISIIEEFTGAFNIVDQSKETWVKAGKLSYSMKKKGLSVNLADCYIAMIAAENNCKVLTMDKHFDDIKKFLKIELI